MAKRGLTIADLEKAMGQKADRVTDYEFDPETGSFTRKIIFKLRPRKQSEKPE